MLTDEAQLHHMDCRANIVADATLKEVGTANHDGRLHEIELCVLNICRTTVLKYSQGSSCRSTWARRGLAVESPPCIPHSRASFVCSCREVAEAERLHLESEHEVDRLVRTIPSKKACSNVTASITIRVMVSTAGFDRKWRNNMHANAVCMPSSLAMSSFDWHRAGIKPLERIQKMAAKDEEKKIPSTIANATMRVPKSESSDSIHRIHQSALSFTAGIVSMAENSLACSEQSSIKDRRSKLYVSEWIFSLEMSINTQSSKIGYTHIIIWNP